tara:strand:- start:20 stop:496 length:477 start_codon:yes stop_codon:yes gene_type:complete
MMKQGLNIQFTKAYRKSDALARIRDQIQQTINLPDPEAVRQTLYHNAQHMRSLLTPETILLDLKLPIVTSPTLFVTRFEEPVKWPLQTSNSSRLLDCHITMSLVMVSPVSDKIGHLQAIARLSRQWRQKDFQDLILGANNPDSVRALLWDYNIQKRAA